MKDMLGKVVWVGTALAAVHLGLMALGVDVLAMAGLYGLMRPVYMALGALGVVSLVHFGMCMAGSSCSSCGK